MSFVIPNRDKLAYKTRLKRDKFSRARHLTLKEKMRQVGLLEMSIIGMESCAIKHLFQSAVLAQWMNVVNIKHVILRLKLKRFRLNFASTSIKHECCKYRKVCTDEGSELLEKLYSTLFCKLSYFLSAFVVNL